MSGEHGHHVSTRAQARRIINRHGRFWISNCGCREGMGGKCGRSRMDVCLCFGDPGERGASGGSAVKEVSREFVEGVLREAEEKHLICQPFRYGADGKDQGVCFCCDDCCYLFHPEPQPYCKGTLIESTDVDACTDCGKCVEVCHFGARTMKRGKLHVERDPCSGCGLCLDVCPADCIRMIRRPSPRESTSSNRVPS